MTVVAAWMAQQLAEFSAVFDGDDEGRRLVLASDKIAEAFDAEFAVIVLDGVARRDVGLTLDPRLRDALTEVRESSTSIVDEALGLIHIASVAIPRSRDDDRLTVGRVADPFTAVEVTLLRSMARTLGIALDLHDARNVERELHAEIDQRSRSNARLVEHLSQRQLVLDHLFRLQRKITERAPIAEVLDDITTSAAQLIPSSILSLRLVEQGGETAVMVAVVGQDGTLERASERTRVGEGVAGRSISDNCFVLADDYPTSTDAIDDWVAMGVTTAMATPVRRNGQAIGSLCAMSWEAGRRFDGDEQHLLQSLAEHASLAFNDASALEVIQRSLERAVFDAHHDQLTGLANRKQAIGRLEEWAAQDCDTTVIFVDLDRFKSVNDAYGHSTGDEILRNVAERLDDVTRVDDLVARLSGDEFLVIARSPDESTATDLAARIAEELSFTAVVDRREIRVSASVGCARHLPGETADEVVANADLAMYRAKDSGGGQLVQFDGAMRDARTAELTLERELRFAIDHDELDVYFQPIVDLATSAIVGAEALVRWYHPTRGVLAPGAFIETAEASGTVTEIDAIALRRALGHLRQWEAAGLVPEHFRISANVSARQFRNSGLVGMVAEQLELHGLSPNRLWLEITETTMMRDLDECLRTMHGLRELGVHLAVDDFGTGWSSLAYLKQFPVDALKIDQSFVAGLCVSDDDRAIVEATIRLAGALGLGVIAEGVEEPRQAAELDVLGCTSVQGYLYSRPVPPADFAARWFGPVPAVPA